MKNFLLSITLLLVFSAFAIADDGGDLPIGNKNCPNGTQCRMVQPAEPTNIDFPSIKTVSDILSFFFV